MLPEDIAGLDEDGAGVLSSESSDSMSEKPRASSSSLSEADDEAKESAESLLSFSSVSESEVDSLSGVAYARHFRAARVMQTP